MGDGLGLIGLAYRAGKLAAGDASVGDAVRDKRARLICTASDTGDRVRERARRMPERCNGLYLDTHLTRTQMGQSLGYADCSVIAFLEIGLAAAFVRKLAEGDPVRYGGVAAALEAQQKRATLRRAKKTRRDRQNQARGGRRNG